MTKNTLDKHGPLDTQHQTCRFPRMRNFPVDMSILAKEKALIYFLFEADVTEARRQIRLYTERTRQSLSFTSFITYCFAKAIDEDEDRRMHAIRKGRNQLVMFDTVDISVIIEKEVDGFVQPVHYIVRSANKRSFLDVQAEIQRAAALPFEEMYSNEDYILFTLFPWPLRKLMYMTHRSPKAVKLKAGTTVVTSITMFGSGSFHLVPQIPMTSGLAIGGIDERRVPVDGRSEVREWVSLTLTVDHDIIDGGHATRFIERLKDLVKGCHGLPMVPGSDARLEVAGVR